jgi:hypothetical protein
MPHATVSQAQSCDIITLTKVTAGALKTGKIENNMPSMYTKIT